MAKLKDAKITQQDISDYLTSKDDFGFETSVYHACVKQGLHATHGGIYQDPVTKKDRQYDIRARITRELRTVHLAIECKNLNTNYPLVVSCVPITAKESYHEVIISGERGSNLIGVTIEPIDTLRFHENRSMFANIPFIGKSTTQVGRNTSGELVGGDAEVFDKWSQAVASACELVQGASEDYQASGEDVGATIVFPILVIPDGTLWTANYSDKGELLRKPQVAEECFIYLDKSVNFAPYWMSYTFSALQVFTKTKFIGYLQRLDVNDNYWDMIFPKDEMQQAYLKFLTKYA